MEFMHSWDKNESFGIDNFSKQVSTQIWELVVQNRYSQQFRIDDQPVTVKMNGEKLQFMSQVTLRRKGEMV